MNSQSSLMLMLGIFGWDFDREGPKSDDFSSTVAALGVQFNLSKTPSGTVEVQNIQKRLEETVAQVDEILSSKVLGKREALSLRGRLAFCDSFIFGRLGRVALQQITMHAYTHLLFLELLPITLLTP